MPVLANPKQALARGSSATTAYVEAVVVPIFHKQHILARVDELREEQLAIHQQIHCLGTGLLRFQQSGF
jgi:hypothetical protein